MAEVVQVPAGLTIPAFLAVPGRVGVIGSCIGSGIAPLLAPAGGFSAAGVDLGQVPGDAGHFLQGSCPIIASYRWRGPSLRGATGSLEAALSAAEVPHDVEQHPGAGHAFKNRREGAVLAHG